MNGIDASSGPPTIYANGTENWFQIEKMPPTRMQPDFRAGFMVGLDGD